MNKICPLISLPGNLQQCIESECMYWSRSLSDCRSVIHVDDYEADNK